MNSSTPPPPLPSSPRSHLPVLAQIVETDDVVLERSSHGEADATINTPPPSKTHRPSQRIVETVRRSLSNPMRRISWASTSRTKASVISSAAVRTLPWKQRLHFYLSEPAQSRVGWLLHHALVGVLMVNVAAMAAETLDGPRFLGSDPAFAFLPGDAFFMNLEVLFTFIYLFEFMVRCLTAPAQRVYWRTLTTWINILAWLPLLMYWAFAALYRDDAAFDERATRANMTYLRVFRVVRIVAASHVYDGSQVMFNAIMDSIAPLKITLFFLITVVMMFATAIFYAEPCYDLQTCTFTDIFNAGYFVMVTVATVGYGSQVPSLSNAASLLLTTTVMIFGSLYLAMPLAIVGIRYDAAWRRFEEDRLTANSLTQLQVPPIMKAPPSLDSAPVMPGLASIPPPTDEELDETLQPLEARKVFTLSYQICDHFYDLAHKLGSISDLLQLVFTDTTKLADVGARTTGSCTRSRSSNGAADSFTNSKNGSLGDGVGGQLRPVKTRNERITRVLETIIVMLRTHKRVCAEIRGLVPLELLQQQQRLASTGTGITNPLGRDSALGSSGNKNSNGNNSRTKSGRVNSFGRSATMASSMLGRAKSAVKRVVHSNNYLQHVGPPTWRSVTWDVLQGDSRSFRTQQINRVRCTLVMLSIALFYAQTTPELQSTGPTSALCRRSIHDFCAYTKTGFSDQPGCFVLTDEGLPTTQRVDFYCEASSVSDNCYGNAFNYGSDAFPSTCASVFGSKGIQRVCNTRLCQTSALWVDMEPYWIVFEFFFGVLFTIELVLRVVVHPARKFVWNNFAVVIDAIALFPFYVEVAMILGGVTPIYSVVPTAPSFFSIIRVLKTFRILKMGAFISGAEVLARTAFLVYKRLMIPVFFLFIGSVICGAVFYELERGTECYVGETCVWWGKSLLTQAIAGDNPPGKRLLVQNNRPSIIVDMVHSTWFSLVTITTVGYGDMKPRTSFGRLFDILTMIMSACYTAMPLTLVGGQFYVCYEVYLHEQKRKAKAYNPSVEPKQDQIMEVSPAHRVTPQVTQGPVNQLTSDMTSEVRGGSPLNVVGHLIPEPVIPGLNAPVPPPPAPVSNFDPASPEITSVEIEILNRFILIQKVMAQVAEDLSALNKLGSRRVAIKPGPTSAADLAALRQNESEIENKVSENVVFSVSVFLNFAPVIEKILGVKSMQSRPTGVPSMLPETTDAPDYNNALVSG